LVPKLRHRAQRTERLRRLPEETVRDLHATGTLRAAQPARYGGFGLNFDAVFDVAAELGRGCGSAAWCYSIWASHNWIAGMFPRQAQEEYWAKSHNTLSSTSFNPSRSHVVSDNGGYRVSGRWDFASGVDSADWMLVVGNAPDGPAMLMVPKTDYVVEDTWFVSGLRGTGSKDVLIEDVFVPAYRSVMMVDLREARSPGRSLHDTPNYRIPLRSILSFTLASPILGMAQGALEAFECARRGAEPAGPQMRLAESAAEISAARGLMEGSTREIFARAEKNEMPSVDDRVRYRRDQVYVARLAVRAVDRLFEASGGHSLYDSADLQRFHRDIHAAAHHTSMAWDSVAEQYGRVRLGLAPNNVDL
jgi:3-hydroxy-9,10-secoandrosta-1,3,5(10)-triene-9,17-dione monooxygenase